MHESLTESSVFMSLVHIHRQRCVFWTERSPAMRERLLCQNACLKMTRTGYKVHVCASEPAGADSANVLVSLWMEVRRLSWRLCWCQGGSARLTAHVQCVIHCTVTAGNRHYALCMLWLTGSTMWREHVSVVHN